jgi:hypothetical protein
VPGLEADVSMQPDAVPVRLGERLPQQGHRLLPSAEGDGNRARATGLAPKR